MPDTDADREQQPGGPQPDPQLMVVALKVLGGDLGAAQLWFDQRVLDRYRGQEGYRVMRTNSAGRVRAPGGWALDFGIAPDEQVIHATAADLSQRLPAPERSHWANYLLTLPYSKTFLTMRLGAHSCIDDGELRAW